MPADEPFDLQPAQAARLLGVGVSTVQRLADSGGIPSMRTPGGHRRFRRSDLDAYRARQITGAAAS